MVNLQGRKGHEQSGELKGSSHGSSHSIKLWTLNQHQHWAFPPPSRTWSPVSPSASLVMGVMWHASHSVTIPTTSSHDSGKGQHPRTGCWRDREEHWSQGEEGTLTSDAAAIELQPQGNAVVPCLGTDAHKACEHWAVDLVENHLCGILIGLKCLQGKGGTNVYLHTLLHPHQISSQDNRFTR